MVNIVNLTDCRIIHIQISGHVWGYITFIGVKKSHSDCLLQLLGNPHIRKSLYFDSNFIVLMKRLSVLPSLPLEPNFFGFQPQTGDHYLSNYLLGLQYMAKAFTIVTVQFLSIQSLHGADGYCVPLNLNLINQPNKSLQKYPSTNRFSSGET